VTWEKSLEMPLCLPCPPGDKNILKVGNNEIHRRRGRGQQEKFLSHEVTKISLYVDLPRCSRAHSCQSKGKSPSMMVEQ
jgi:hypothetical protein